MRLALCTAILVMACGVALCPQLASAATLQTFKDIPPPEPFLPIPTSGPNISNVSISSNGMVLRARWTTDSSSTGRIEYGTSDAYGKILEDRSFVMDHEMTISTATGTLHLRISSSDIKKQRSSTTDIPVAVPEPVIPSSTVPLAVTSTATATTIVVPAAKTISAVPTSTKSEDPAATTTVSEPDKPPALSLSLTDAVLGGLGVLSAGVLIGLVFKGK